MVDSLDEFLKKNHEEFSKRNLKFWNESLVVFCLISGGIREGIRGRFSTSISREVLKESMEDFALEYLKLLEKSVNKFKQNP